MAGLVAPWAAEVARRLPLKQEKPFEHVGMMLSQPQTLGPIHPMCNDMEDHFMYDPVPVPQCISPPQIEVPLGISVGFREYSALLSAKGPEGETCQHRFPRSLGFHCDPQPMLLGVPEKKMPAGEIVRNWRFFGAPFSLLPPLQLPNGVSSLVCLSSPDHHGMGGH